MLDLELPAADLARLLRSPALAALRRGRARTVPASIVWHDTAAGDLAERGLALSQGACANQRGLWRVERLRPKGPCDWLPGWQAPVLAEGATHQSLGHDLPDGLQPIAAFQGSMRRYTLDDGAGLSVLEGTLRGVAQDRGTCRLLLQGEAQMVTALALRLGEAVRLRVPRASLAAEALAVATGRAPEPRHLGAPATPPGLSVGDALVMATGHLADVILHWAAQVPKSSSPEPVHQMRVAIRRLRSALTVFRRVAHASSGEPSWLEALNGRLRVLAAELGAARDWDVFLAETGAAVAQAFADDRRIAQLLTAAGRRRAAAYAVLGQTLGGDAWGRMELALALLPTTQPWQASATQEQAGWLAAPLRPFAADALSRRLKRVIAPGKTVAHLSPHELHAIRKHAKRLRYAIEFFSPLFPAKQVRRTLSRLEHLQEVLGAVNDTAVAAALMSQLGGGADRAFAAGVVQGFGAGRAAYAADGVERAWAKFYRMEPFWE